MMNNQHLKDFPVWERGAEQSIVRCEVSYSKGGMNMWSYEQEPRGYWLHVTPLVLEKGDGFTVQKHALFSGHKFFLLEAKRFSAKAMRDAVLIGAQRLNDPTVVAFIEELTRVPVEA
jgi:hypothetical protein